MGKEDKKTELETARVEAAKMEGLVYDGSSTHDACNETC
jgi:hypothetical protein